MPDRPNGNARSGGIPGAASLIAVAVVLALAAFAAMCLATASADQRIVFRMLDADDAWHEADAAARRTLAVLRTGQDVEGVSRTGNLCEYETPVDGNRSIYVRVDVRDDGTYEILSWRTARSSEWTPDQQLHVAGSE